MRSTKQPRYNPLFQSHLVYVQGEEIIGTRLYREACLWLSLSRSRARSVLLLGEAKCDPGSCGAAARPRGTTCIFVTLGLMTRVYWIRVIREPCC
jgi:hypothetical protein